VTGTGGLGLETAVALAGAGAEVVVAGRNSEKGKQAIARVLLEVPAATVFFEPLDLADLRSVREFAVRLERRWDGLEVLVNNAAVMALPKRRTTIDRFEMQFGTNYLGHFALTAHLMPLLLTGTSSRVVTLSSIAAREGVLNLEDLQSEARYQPMEAYAQSKLACLMFALEMDRRSKKEGWGVTSVAAHPGISRTDLLPNGAGPKSLQGLARKYLWFLFQPASQGALPTLFAATAPGVSGGEYYGPNRLSETRGFPAKAMVPPQALDGEASSRLWEASENLTGVTFASPSFSK
jgi:NAD(P)-dependent dehydrogenase (short-subunit alcohol dehydrogenase family)